MEGFALSEHVKQELGDMPVQSMEKSVEKPKKGRSQEEKIGRLKYNQVLLKKVLDKIEKLEQTQQVILNGLKGAGYFKFSVPLIQRYACSDQVDIEIVDRIHEEGAQGVFPKDVAASLTQYGLEYYDVSRRIVRMNKRLLSETGELLFEKRGHKWALTRFAFENYGVPDP
jgi:coenzyme F420-reducing hydrogenase delta subunit